MRSIETEKYLWHGKSDAVPYDPCNFRKAFVRALKGIGVRPLNPHEARHTYVSELQAAGVDIETISYMTGHADIDMTEHYLHVRSSVTEAAAEKLNSTLVKKR